MDVSQLCAVWDCLHDGYIVATTDRGEHVSFDVVCPYMAKALGHPEDRAFRVSVDHRVQWDPWERRAGEREPPVFEDIARTQASVMSGEKLRERVGVTLLFDEWNANNPSRQSGGRLLLAAGGAALTWADGEKLSAADLLAASARYWAAPSAPEKPITLSYEEAIDLLLRDEISEIDNVDKRDDLYECANQSCEGWPGWADVDPSVLVEIKNRALPEDVSSERYVAFLMFYGRYRYKGMDCGCLHDGLVERGYEFRGVRAAPPPEYPCACRGRCTVEQPGTLETCPVCWWQDDVAQPHSCSSDFDGEQSEITLEEARANYLRHGLFDPSRWDLAGLGDSPEKYAIGRVFTLDEDGTVMEQPTQHSGYCSPAIPGRAPSNLPAKREDPHELGRPCCHLGR